VGPHFSEQGMLDSAYALEQELKVGTIPPKLEVGQ
jgi:hypothetical protein